MLYDERNAKWILVTVLSDDYYDKNTIYCAMLPVLLLLVFWKKYRNVTKKNCVATNMVFGATRIHQFYSLHIGYTAVIACNKSKIEFYMRRRRKNQHYIIHNLSKLSTFSGSFQNMYMKKCDKKSLCPGESISRNFLFNTFNR